MVDLKKLQKEIYQTMKDDKKALVLFSGGKDSLIVTLRLLDSNYKVYLVTYENGCGLKTENVNNTIERLVKKYGTEKIENIGIKNISGFFREFIYPFYNYTSSYIKENYGDITISQFNCLACRLSMYIASIILCNRYNIKNVFDGARRSQLFAIEQREMLNKFEKLFSENGININYPLENETDDWKLKNELLLRGIVPKTLEPQCLLGVPTPSNEKEGLGKNVLMATANVYEKYLKQKAKEIIGRYKDLKLNGDFI